MTAWWDRYLMGRDTGIEREPQVDVQTSDGKWRTETSWPPPGTAPQVFYTHPAAAGAGTLQTRSPGPEADQAIIDDPSLSENRMLQNPDQADPARLTYRGKALAAAMRIAGTPVIDIRAASDSVGTHYAALLCDVDPSGKWTIAGRGFGNARYRATPDGLEQGQDLVPGQDYRFRLKIRDLDYTFAAGHSVGLVLSSSNSVWALPSEYRATNTIHNGSGGQNTTLTLPVVGLAGASTTAPGPGPSSAPMPHLPNTGGDNRGAWPWLPVLCGIVIAGLARTRPHHNR